MIQHAGQLMDVPEQWVAPWHEMVILGSDANQTYTRQGVNGLDLAIKSGGQSMFLLSYSA